MTKKTSTSAYKNPTVRKEAAKSALKATVSRTGTPYKPLSDLRKQGVSKGKIQAAKKQAVSSSVSGPMNLTKLKKLIAASTTLAEAKGVAHNIRTVARTTRSAAKAGKK